jgi:hypothetical protein
MNRKQLCEMSEAELRERSKEAMQNGNKVLVNQIYAEMSWRQ